MTIPPEILSIAGVGIIIYALIDFAMRTCGRAAPGPVTEPVPERERVARSARSGAEGSSS